MSITPDSIRILLSSVRVVSLAFFFLPFHGNLITRSSIASLQNCISNAFFPSLYLLLFPLLYTLLFPSWWAFWCDLSVTFPVTFLWRFLYTYLYGFLYTFWQFYLTDFVFYTHIAQLCYINKHWMLVFAIFLRTFPIFGVDNHFLGCF